ncbi:hypothetical protein F4678DRAFT_444574 [Xylaria arbuscula]|nr:hypothetical protein F4678DRAFT_444574 [Xylaria arbuscula]
MSLTHSSNPTTIESLSDETLMDLQKLFRDERNTRILSAGCTLASGIFSTVFTHGISLLISGVMGYWHGIRAYEAKKTLKVIRDELESRGRQFKRTSFRSWFKWKNFIAVMAAPFGVIMDMTIMSQLTTAMALTDPAKEVLGGVMNEAMVKTWEKNAPGVKKVHF